MDGKNETDREASPSQHDRFVETARSLGCDENEDAFDEKLKAIVQPSLPKGGNPGGDRAKPSRERRKP